MKVRIWGARGSFPASGARFAGFGHHTPCVSVEAGETLVVLDAGSGAAALGLALRGRPIAAMHVLLSHFHHDHMTGLPFLLHGVGPGTSITIHAALGEDVALATLVGTLFAQPYFPDEGGEALRQANFISHRSGAVFALNGFRVASAPLAHPGGAAAYRLDHGGAALVYATDLEAVGEPAPDLLRLARGADLLIHDTMFTDEEARARVGWGHSTAEAAIDLATRGGVARVLGFHHSPEHDDAVLMAREAEARQRFPGFSFAREGETITL